MLGIVLLLGVAQLSHSYVYADAEDQVGAGIKTVDPGATPQKANSDITNLIKNAVKLLSWVIGIVSVLMIMFGGFRYATSGGDSNAVASAKRTIIYAVIGLVVAVLAQILVRYVIGVTK
jgi:hypothetical protein